MTLRDFIKIPFTKIDYQFVAYVASLPLIIPGILLWAVTLGGFRFFHLFDMWTDYTIQQSIHNSIYD